MLRRHPAPRNLAEYAGMQSGEPHPIELAEHIESCPRCARTVEALRRFDSLMRNSLPEIETRTPGPDCLPPIMLADYLEGFSSPEQRAATEEHLVECRSCRNTVVELHSLLEKQGEEDFAEPDNDMLGKTLGSIINRLDTPFVRCPACDKENVRQSSVCLDCGARLKPTPVALVCISCGQRIRDAGRFCATCGAAIAPPEKTLGFLFTRRRSILELLRAYVWLLAGLSAIGLSFFSHRFFIQLTALGLILCVKGILDQAKFRIYAEMLKILRKETGSDEEVRKRASSNR